MTERLIDEQLECMKRQTWRQLYERRMIDELLDLRAEVIALSGALKMAAAERYNFAAALAAGPVMPETPSDKVIYAIEVEKARGAGGAINFYNAIRNVLHAEQNDPR